MSTYLKDALLHKVAASKDEEEETSDALKRTYKGAAIGAGLGGLAGGAYLGGAAHGAIGVSGGTADDVKTIVPIAGGIGGLMGAGAGAALGAVAPHVAVGMMALLRNADRKLSEADL